MTFKDVNKILVASKLPSAENFEQIKVGFTNKIYLIDDQYILKVCADTKNEAPFRREVQLYNYFNSKLPVPEVIVYDDSKTLIQYHYMVYQKIEGDNLYNIWHQLSTPQRRNAVKQLCEMLKVINKTELEDLPTGLDLKPVNKWQNVITKRIQHYLTVTRQMHTLSEDQANKVAQFVQKNANCLSEQKLALCYWDVHFDNLVVHNDKITGLLDFERSEIASIDFVLDTVKRMVDFPKKYMSEYAEQFAKNEDYEGLLSWYEEYYPELFDFKNLSKRLDLYSIAHDLKDLESWPHVQQLKDNILKIADKKLYN